MKTLTEELLLMRDTFHANQLEFAVCGGIAMQIYDMSRDTFDIDVVIHPDVLSTAFNTLQSLGFQASGEQRFIKHRNQRRIFQFKKGDLNLDVLVLTSKTQWIWDTRKFKAWHEELLPVISPAGMIFLKQLRGYEIDVFDIEYLQQLSHGL